MPKYDVAVVGAGLGGLAAAALLSAKKKRVIVIEPGVSYSGSVGIYERDGYRFCALPALSYGFETGGVFSTLAANIGITWSRFFPSPCYQVALPDHRISVFADQRETVEELRREFPREIDALFTFYRDLHRLAERRAKNRLSAFVTMHRSAAGFIRSYRFSRDLTVFFDIQSRYFFHRPVTELSLMELIMLCDTPPFSLSGGFTKLAKELNSAILQRGGEFLYEQTQNEFTWKGSRVAGIKTKQDVIAVDTILLNRAIQADSSTVFMGLHDTVIPVGMCPVVLYLPDYRSPRDYFALSLRAYEDDAGAPKGMRALSVSFRSENGSAVDKRSIADQLNRLIPFLNEYLVFREEQRIEQEGSELTESVTFKPLRSGAGAPFLYRGSRKNVYLLNNAQTAPLQVMSGVDRFVKHVS